MWGLIYFVLAIMGVTVVLSGCLLTGMLLQGGALPMGKSKQLRKLNHDIALKNASLKLASAELEVKKKERDLLNMEQLIETQRALNAKELDMHYRKALELEAGSKYEQVVVDVEDVVKDFNRDR